MKALVISSLLVGGLFMASGCRITNTPGEPSSDLVILKAVYGAGMTNVVDVTDLVRSLAVNGSINLHPQWALGVDPAWGKTKRLTVAYRYKEQIGVASFDQFEELNIPLPPDQTSGGERRDAAPIPGS